MEHRLTVDGRTVCPLEIPEDRKARRRGLLGRDGVDGAMLFRRTGSVHTFFMRFSIDVAFCDRDLVVLHTTTLPPFRLTRPSLRPAAVVEAEAGSFTAWGIERGSRLGVTTAAT